MLQIRRCVLLLTLAFLSGCGKSTDKAKVSGVVSWNGELIQNGFVTFAPLDSRLAPEAGPVRDGRFDFYAPPGKSRVEITASKEQGFSKGMNQPNIVQFIPPEYNLHSQLVEEVSLDGENHFDFTLTGKNE